MNKGTRTRGGLGIAALIMIGLCIFGNMPLIIDIIAFTFCVIMMAANHWFNNDYSEEHCEATGMARLKVKERKQKDFIGERFFEDVDEEVDHE